MRDVLIVKIEFDDVFVTLKNWAPVDWDRRLAPSVSLSGVPTTGWGWRGRHVLIAGSAALGGTSSVTFLNMSDVDRAYQQ